MTRQMIEGVHLTYGGGSQFSEEDIKYMSLAMVGKPVKAAGVVIGKIIEAKFEDGQLKWRMEYNDKNV